MAAARPYAMLENGFSRGRDRRVPPARAGFGTREPQDDEHQRKAGAIRQRELGRSAVVRRRTGLVSLLLPAALALASCVASPPPGPASSGSPSSLTGTPADGTPATSAPLETSQASNKAPVYWIGRSEGENYLYREFRDVEDQENPVTRALRVMMSQQPADPDFFTPWQNPKKLATSISGQNVITVDVSADAFNSNVDAATAELAVQQLVYTATAAGASAGLIDSGRQIQVMVLVDGHTDYRAFKHVPLGAPTSRAAGVVAPVWIIDPQEGAELADRPVKVSGRSTAPGGTLHWEVLRIDGEKIKTPVLNGNATAAPAGDPAEAGTFSFTAALPPGSYEARVAQTDASGAADKTVDRNGDTRAFTVK